MLNRLCNHASLPHHSALLDGVATDEVSPLKRLVEVDSIEAALQTSGNLRDKLSLACAALTRQPQVVGQMPVVMQGNQGLVQMHRLEDVVIHDNRGRRVSPHLHRQVREINRDTLVAVTGISEDVTGSDRLGDRGQGRGDLLQHRHRGGLAKPVEGSADFVRDVGLDRLDINLRRSKLV